jgi:hypothetical protein
MSFFDNELRKIFGESPQIRDARFVGRACIGRLGDAVNVKLRFVAPGKCDHYEGIRVTVFNRSEGKIDEHTFLFGDILGRKAVCNPNFPEGLVPHIWTDDAKSDWYVYKPNADDRRAMAGAVGDYLETFLEPFRTEREPEKPAPKTAKRSAPKKKSITAQLEEAGGEAVTQNAQRAQDPQNQSKPKSKREGLS